METKLIEPAVAVPHQPIEDNVPTGDKPKVEPQKSAEEKPRESISPEVPRDDAQPIQPITEESSPDAPLPPSQNSPPVEQPAPTAP